jgi:hypothetical protein
LDEKAPFDCWEAADGLRLLGTVFFGEEAGFTGCVDGGDVRALGAGEPLK